MHTQKYKTQEHTDTTTKGIRVNGNKPESVLLIRGIYTHKERWRKKLLIATVWRRKARKRKAGKAKKFNLFLLVCTGDISASRLPVQLIPMNQGKTKSL